MQKWTKGGSHNRLSSFLPDPLISCLILSHPLTLLLLLPLWGICSQKAAQGQGILPTWSKAKNSTSALCKNASLFWLISQGLKLHKVHRWLVSSFSDNSGGSKQFSVLWDLKLFLGLRTILFWMAVLFFKVNLHCVFLLCLCHKLRLHCPVA